MSAKRRFILINLVGLAGALFFYFTLGKQPINIPLFGVEFPSTPSLMVFITYVCGAIIGAGSVVPFVESQQKDSVAKLREWKDQDAKLALEVQSDKEKQLEAKIATLESALKQALNR